ncbi:MAG: translation initiation factor IF-3 [Deltaproteobacteria bacterium]|nr:translation initiation factor IF-3 [Deltaproteobacteria bacterium]MBW2019842.1 translation initiation factor IF-3 [Deltaproteobacteria bacterium]MBW2074646.1 translation initiation factor IF-3 [Deltaproteobacteria bacterium]RLB80687.1 MAG: translation initiation factor IF-3 [Deltaproteobacteria bacterium]
MAKRINVNQRIRAREVRLIDPDGKQVGVVPLAQALETAKSHELDLVEVAPNVSPPVCRIMDYGRYKYQQNKKLQEAKKRQSTFQVKEIKMRPQTGEHDLQVKLRHIKRFLHNRDKVKVTIMFRGRELAYTDLGGALLQRVIEETSEFAVVEQEARREGRVMVMVLAPK